MFVVELGGKRPAADAGGIGLHDADDPIDVLGIGTPEPLEMPTPELLLLVTNG